MTSSRGTLLLLLFHKLLLFDILFPLYYRIPVDIHVHVVIFLFIFGQTELSTNYNIIRHRHYFFCTASHPYTLTSLSKNYAIAVACLLTFSKWQPLDVLWHDVTCTCCNGTCMLCCNWHVLPDFWASHRQVTYNITIDIARKTFYVQILLKCITALYPQ